MNMKDKEIVLMAMKIIGSIKSEKKAIAVRRNGKLGGRPKKIKGN